MGGGHSSKVATGSKDRDVKRSIW